MVDGTYRPRARWARRCAAALAALVLAVGVGASPAFAFTMDSGTRTCSTGFGGQQLHVFTYNYAAGDDVAHIQFVGNTTYHSYNFGDNLPPATRYRTFGLTKTPTWIVMAEIQENDRSGAQCML
jgi:hypothetical protein